MHHRRIAGLVAWLLMLQLVLAGSDLICLQHGNREGRATTSVSLPDGADATHQHGGQNQRHEHTPGELPSLPGCCQAMTSCSASLVLHAAAGTVSLALGHDSAIALNAARPPSRIDAPDPPPPKA